MAVGLNVAQAAVSACKQAAASVTVTVTLTGGDKWDTGSGSQDRSFTVTLRSGS